MKKIIIMFLYFIFSTFASAEENSIIQRFTNPKNCSSCHKDQVKDWSTSLHSRSHEDSNELYRQSVKLASLDLKQPFETTLVACGTCHNPRLEIKDLSDNYMIAKTFGITTEETSTADKAISATHIKNGISCYICHNVNSIDPKETSKEVGYKLINWTNNDTIVGPYEFTSDKTKFHQSSSREFFQQGNELCLICHQGQATNNPLSIYNTGKEYDLSNSTKRCVDCHMGEPKEGMIGLEGAGGAKKMVRSHLFAGVRNDVDLLKENIKIEFNRISNDMGEIIIENLTPHKMPTGFSGRSLMIQTEILGQNSASIKKDYELKAVYISASREQTLSYGAKELRSDNRLNPFEKRAINIKIPTTAKELKISIGYYILSPVLQQKMTLEDKTYTKMYEIESKSFELTK